MSTFRLKKKSGNHIGPPDAKGNRITYKSGDRVISDEDLVAKHPNKFELISASDEMPVPTSPNIPAPSKKKLIGKKESKSTKHKDMEEPIIPEASEKSEHGVDVTKEFPTAIEAELLVFEKSKWFTVVDPDDDEVLNEKKLRRDKVEAFVADYLQDDDDEDNEDNDENEDEDEGTVEDDIDDEE